MRHATHLTLAAFALALFLIPRAPSRVSAARAAYDCEGDACSSVPLTWDNDRQQFRADNNSDRGVKVEVSTYGGVSAVHVEPHKSEYLLVKTFSGPYHADFE